jgi:hypothetical protein
MSNASRRNRGPSEGECSQVAITGAAAMSRPIAARLTPICTRFSRAATMTQSSVSATNFTAVRLSSIVAAVSTHSTIDAATVKRP